MKQIIVLTALLTSIALIGFLVWQSDIDQRKQFLTKYNLNTMSTLEIIEYLERKIDEPLGFKASITGTKLILGDDTTTIEMPLPKNLFYLSFAPYINQTHPCSNHNLVTCTGELKQTVFEITITNPSSGKVVFEGSLKSSAKGFVGIWLPKDETLVIHVKYHGLTAETIIRTQYNQDTCLTTLLLQ